MAGCCRVTAAPDSIRGRLHRRHGPDSIRRRLHFRRHGPDSIRTAALSTSWPVAHLSSWPGAPLSSWAGASRSPWLGAPSRHGPAGPGHLSRHACVTGALTGAHRNAPNPPADLLDPVPPRGAAEPRHLRGEPPAPPAGQRPGHQHRARAGAMVPQPLPPVRRLGAERRARPRPKPATASQSATRAIRSCRSWA